MKIIKTLLLFFLLSFSFDLILRSQGEGGLEEDWKQMEHFLRTARITSVVVREDAGRTAPWDVILDDGKTHRKARFKNIDLARPELLPDSYHYEIAAYELSKLLDMSIIPPVVEREIEGIKGSLQLFLEDCIPLDRQRRMVLEAPDPQRLADALDDLAVFENLSYCKREESDILIHGKDWSVCRVDFSEAFDPEKKMFSGSKIQRCSEKLYLKLADTNPNDFRSRLENHLNAEEIQALVSRRELILNHLRHLIQERGREAVLFIP
ncbi:MAG: hypothetical protein JXB23_01115 [Candidatus Aminicenantes bacterium]|nr:hypothetical protein [Candidatus Aminicenantes bacterium]